MDIRKLKEDQMYEYLKSLSEDEKIKIVEEVNNNLEKYTEDDLYFLQNFSNVLERLTDDIRYREEFYFELYNLIDKNHNLTKLGEYYANIFTHHYIKAFKMYKTFSKSLREKNEIFRKNEKAIEYLEYFRNHIIDEHPSKVIKKDRRKNG